MKEDQKYEQSERSKINTKKASKVRGEAIGEKEKKTTKI